MGDVEIVLKMFLCSYFIFNYVRDHSVRTISLGAAAGAILACLVAGYEIAFLDQARADGPTNAIRFGMLAILFSGISLMALLFLQKPRSQTHNRATICGRKQV